MAFQNKNLSVIAYANGFTLWHYASSDKLADISGEGYFNSVSSLQNTGDLIIVNAGDGTIILKIESTSPKVKSAKLC